MVKHNKYVTAIIFASLLIIGIVGLFVFADGSEYVTNRAIGAIGSSPGILNTAPVGEIKIKNISGLYNLSLFIQKELGQNEFVSNVSIAWQSKLNDTIMTNITLNNISGQSFFGGPGIASLSVVGCGTADAGWSCSNRSYWNISSFGTTGLPDGIYNLTILIYNWTGGNSSLNLTNVTASINITIDNSAPAIANVSMNFTTNSNYTRAGWVALSAMVNETANHTKNNINDEFSGLVAALGMTSVQNNVSFELVDLRNNNRTNFSSAGPSAGTWNVSVNFQALGDGVYTVIVYANDSVGNRNSSGNNTGDSNSDGLLRGNVTFRLDSGVINVTSTSANGLQDRNFTGTATVELTFNATVNDSVTSIRSTPLLDFKTNGTAFNRSSTITEGRWNLTLNTTQFNQGRHTVTIYANDSLNNENKTQTIDFRVDGTVPQLHNLTMNVTNGTNYTRSGAIALSVSTNDSITVTNGVIFEIQSITNGTQYNVTLGSSNWGEGPLGLWIHNLTLSTFTDGLYQVRVYANDTVNNVNVTLSQVNNSFRIDGTAPNITYHSLNVTNGTNFTRSGAIRFNLSAADAITSVTDRVIFEIINLVNGTSYNLTTAMRDVNGFQSINLTLADQADGLYEVRLYVNDTLGNINTSYRNLSYRVDGTVPQLRNLSMNVTNGTNYTRSGAIALSINANDSITVTNGVIFEIQSITNGTQYNVTLASSNWGDGPQGLWIHNLTLSTFTDGLYQVRVYANDTLNNINVTLSQVNNSFRIDGTAPNITHHSMNISNNTNFSRSGAIRFNLSAADAITSVLDRVHFEIINLKNGTKYNLTTAMRDADGFQSVNLTLADQADGLYDVRLYVNDTLGNINTSYRNLSYRVDGTAPNISYMSLNVTNGTNFSGADAVRINISIIDSVTSAKDNVTFQLISLYNGSTYNFSTNSYQTQGSFTFWHRNISLSSVDDGAYDVRIYANDTLGNINSSWRNLTLRIDRAPPNVTNVSWHNVSNFANLSIGLSDGFINLTAYINDSTTHVDVVLFGINSTNGTTNGTQFNVTTNASSRTSQLWYAVINLSQLTEGLHGITVYADDDLGNRNSTETKIIRLDRTAPSVTVTCSPATPTAGQTVTCDCSATDTGSQIKTSAQFTSGGISESTTASGSGTFTSSTCRATDFADNVGEATGSWTIASSSTSGGSAGGSGGGVSNSVKGQVEKKTWNSINAGETATLPVQNGALGITQLSFKVEETVYGAVIQVEKQDSLPSNVKSFNNKMYRTLKILDTNVQKGLKGSVTVDFKVEKAWLASNNLNKNEVALFRYVDDKWTELKTIPGEDDGTYVHYGAETPGFSYFIIGQKSTNAAETTTKSKTAETPAETGAETTTAGETTEETSEATSSEEGTSTEESSTRRAIWPWVVTVIIIVVVAWFFLRPKKPQKPQVNR